MSAGPEQNGDTVDVNPVLVEQVRRRLETDGLMITGTVKKVRPEVLHRAATLAVGELVEEANPFTWGSARTRPFASSDIDDPRDVVIGRLAVILGVADGGHHPASYDALISAAQSLRGRVR